MTTMAQFKKPSPRVLVELILIVSFAALGIFLIFGDIISRPALPSEAELVEARHWTRLSPKLVQCKLCFRSCTIPEGSRGYCGVRVNKGGTLYTLVYSMPAAIQIDPVEKEPLFHFFPEAVTLCFGTAGCNFKCSFCHNWHLSTRLPEEVESVKVTPEEAVDLALKYGCQSISFTYNEPTVFYEWVYDVAKLAKEKGLKVYFHTNGAIKPEPMRELLAHLDAVCVDLKAFTAEFYKVTSVSELDPVLSTLKTIKEEGVWFEVVNLMIPTLNDDMGKIREMCAWIRKELGENVPLHFTRYFPAYKLSVPPTPIETLERSKSIALEEGLKYVYIGNVPGHEANSTFCPNCGKFVIERIHFDVLFYHIKDGRCGFCGFEIPGVWW